MEHHDDDDELLVRLRAIDPAAPVTPAPPERVARLLEDAMSHDPDHAADVATQAAPRRTRFAWVAAAAAVAVIGGGFAVASLGGDDDPAPTAQQPTSQSPAGSTTAPSAEPGSTTALVAPEAANAKCMAPNVQVLQANSLAFDGTVTAIDGDQVTLQPTQWFKGTPSETVTVTAPDEQLQQLLVAVDFQEGERYLVTAFQDTVTLCGFSAAWSEDLAALYESAYGG